MLVSIIIVATLLNCHTAAATGDSPVVSDMMAAFEGLNITLSDAISLRMKNNDDDREGVHLFVTQAVAKGTRLVKVPARSVLAGQSSEDLRRVLMTELQRSEGPWLEYLALLPSRFPTLPMLLSSQQTNACLCKHFQELHAAHKANSITSKLELRALCIEKTRSIRYGNQNFVLVPFIDFANHNSLGPNAAIDFHKTGAVSLRALRTILEGESVTIDYGHISPIDFVDRYGFLNVSDVSKIPAQIHFPKHKVFPQHNCSFAHPSLYYNVEDGSPSAGLDFCFILTALYNDPPHLATFLAKRMPDFGIKRARLSGYGSVHKSIYSLLEHYQNPSNCEVVESPAISLAKEAAEFMQEALLRVLQYNYKNSDKIDKDLKKDREKYMAELSRDLRDL